MTITELCFEQSKKQQVMQFVNFEMVNSPKVESITEYSALFRPEIPTILNEPKLLPYFFPTWHRCFIHSTIFTLFFLTILNNYSYTCKVDRCITVCEKGKQSKSKRSFVVFVVVIFSYVRVCFACGKIK